MHDISIEKPPERDLGDDRAAKFAQPAVVGQNGASALLKTVELGHVNIVTGWEKISHYPSTIAREAKRV